MPRLFVFNKLGRDLLDKMCRVTRGTWASIEARLLRATRARVPTLIPALERAANCTPSLVVAYTRAMIARENQSQARNTCGLPGGLILAARCSARKSGTRGIAAHPIDRPTVLVRCW